ncbi:hypothetical protein PENANT_c071G04858 [Penicillium antarcticum]|uniref:Fibronectin type-III domain-containing protein n=1 Tax=Penicillium antarcticum TaxID=416450 RepID=A0A1V6PPK2_9EURO|nr:hypothetical protein PENANT_c071G04858 [Penicillium antarcticum]
MAAVGDSYSAGIGSGNRLGSLLSEQGAFFCSRYDESYPYLVHNDGRLGDPSTRTFQFHSCSGAVISEVIKEQLPLIDAGQQVILLSAGGNDAELTNILNQCIFQWAAYTPLQVASVESALEESQFEWKDAVENTLGLEENSIGCDAQLAKTKKFIGGDAFSKSLDSVISAAKLKLASDGMIYYTGYAKFFAEDLSSECDKVTWSMWHHKASNKFQDNERLTKAHRKEMNDLVDAVNSQIAAAVERAGDQVKFVDYDWYVGHFNGRYCEAGVDESTTESNGRSGLMFFEMNSMDVFGNNPWKRSLNTVPEASFEGQMNALAQITLLLDPDAEFSQEQYVSDATADSVTTASLMSVKVAAANSDADAPLQVRSVLPDGFLRVFHPQPLLHSLIASLVIYEMTNKNQLDNGLSSIPERATFDSCPMPSSSGSSDSNAADGQQIAVASYINPTGDPTAWDRLVGYDESKMPILIANVVNGPDSTVDASWTKVIDRGSASGKTVLGYVRTGYLGVSTQKFQTRLGSGDLADWTAQIEEDIDMWYNLYDDSIGGIFFDEGWPECGDSNQYVDLYKHINDYTKRNHPGAYTVLNPGSPMASCFEDTMDTLLTFELDYDAYVNKYTPNDWTPKDPRKLWHIIYNVPEDKIDEVIKLSKERGAGFVQLTDDLLPNPYDNLPVDSYMTKMLAAVDGGSLLNEDASSWKSGSGVTQVFGLKVLNSDYTSGQISWNKVDNALAYSVYLGDKLVASLPSSMTQVTLGGLTPGGGYAFNVRAVGGGGNMGLASDPVTINPDALPGGKTVANWKSVPKEGSTTITADVLVPYAFVRLYIWSQVGCDFDEDPGWSVNFKVDKYVCTHYMVEGTTLYKYSGTMPKGSTTPPWSWTSIGTVDVDVDAYTYTWTLPIGTNTADTSKFVVQTQGYNPAESYVEPRADDYDCQGSTMCTTPDFLKWCDHAVNVLHRDDYPFYQSSGGLNGNCWGDQTRGCQVFVQGAGCSISGNDMWNAYQNIRKIGGCETAAPNPNRPNMRRILIGQQSSPPTPTLLNLQSYFTCTYRVLCRQSLFSGLACRETYVWMLIMELSLSLGSVRFESNEMPAPSG